MNAQTRHQPWLTVMKREIVVRGLNKAFLISTAVTMVAMIAIGGLLWFLDRPAEKVIAVTEDQGAAIVTALDAKPDDENTYTARSVADVAAGEALVADGTAAGLLTRSDDGWEFVVKEIDVASGSLPAAIATATQSAVVADNAAAQGVDLAQLQAGSTVTTRSLNGSDDGTALISYFVSLALSALFFFTALTYGMQIAQSVVEEKQSRIVEILVSAIPVRHLLLGKIAGVSVLALVQMLLLAGAGVVVMSLTGATVALPSLGAGVGWFIAFFVAGFIALSTIWAAAGAMATRQEDLSQTTMPLMTVLMAAYFVGFMATGSLKVGLSFVPILSSFLMPARLMLGEAQWWEALIALTLTIVFCALAILAGERIYRRGILQTNKVMGIKDLVTRRASRPTA